MLEPSEKNNRKITLPKYVCHKGQLGSDSNSELRLYVLYLSISILFMSKMDANI